MSTPVAPIPRATTPTEIVESQGDQELERAPAVARAVAPIRNVDRPVQHYYPGYVEPYQVQYTH